MQKLTVKQERFCQLYVELGGKGRAYKEAYDTDKSIRTCDVDGCKLSKQPHIAARIAELKEEAKERHNVTVDSIVAELNELKELAVADNQLAVARNTVMDKAKLYGLDKQIIDHTSSDGSIAPTIIQLVAPSV